MFENVRKHGLLAFVGAAVVAAAMALALAPGYAFAANPNEAITIQVERNGVIDPSSIETFTYADLVDEEVINVDTIGGLYNKPGQGFTVVGGKNYVKVQDLLALAGVSSSDWKAGAKLHYTCDDGDYSKHESSYNEITRAQFFFPYTTQTVGVPSPTIATYGAIAFDNAQVLIPASDGVVTPTALSTLTSISSWTTSPRLIVGLTAAELNDGDYNMGKRMPSMVDTITVVAP